MKKRIIPLMTVLCLLLCLLPSAAFAAETGGTVDTSRSYNFELTAERGQTEVKAAPGDIITVSLVLRRTDSAETAKMYGMQTEIEYDDTFLQLVESSVMTASGVRWNDLGRRTGGRAFYLNFVSFKGGESWEPEVLVGSFQMKVLGTSGVSSLTPVNTMVPTQDGMGRYAAEDNAVTVIVSTECTVSFESNGGTDVPSQTVHYGDKVKKPADPTRKGYHLEGWYSNLDRTEKWDFDTDVVKGNLTLYANWAEGAAGGSGVWWLMYYRNHCYPYMSPGWGSTSDYILLSDGDTWDVAMFTNWSFYSSGGAFTCFDKDAYTVRPGTELTVTSKAYGTTFKDGDFYDFENLDVYLYSDSWEQLDMLKDAGSGKATFTFTAPKEEGTYYIVGFDPNRKIPTDDSGGTNYAKIAPATAILTVSGTAELERPFQTVSVDGKALDGKNISYEGIVSLGSEDNEEFKNVYEDVPKYHVIVPEGTQTVDITYGKDVDIYHADATAYGYETDLAADAVSSATIRSVTLESSYKANDDGTQTVATPVARYVRNADGTAMAVTLESGSGKNFRPVALFTFEYAKAEPDPEPEVKYGDVNGDGNINSTDAAILYRSVNGKYTLPDSQKAAADVNGDGAVNSTDAALIYRKANGKMSNFPAES